MYAMVTKYHGPSGHRGSRITATAGGRSVSIGYEPGLGSEDNHIAARTAWIKKYAGPNHAYLKAQWKRGELPNGATVHVAYIPESQGEY